MQISNRNIMTGRHPLIILSVLIFKMDAIVELESTCYKEWKSLPS